MNYYREALLVRRFVSDQTEEWEWDDFISIRTDDEILNAFKGYCSDVQQAYPSPSAYCNKKGFEKMLEAAESLAQGGDVFLRWLASQ